MNLTRGELYFINETDFKTGERSEYYKIGIVRDITKRDSKNRLLEHQTGNPRKLELVKTLIISAVEKVETNLHYFFASNRVAGEWMCFTDAELQKAYAKAEELSDEIKLLEPDFKRAEELKDIASNGQVFPANDQTSALYATIMNFKEVIRRCGALITLYNNYLYKEFKKGNEISAQGTVQNRAGAKRFDKKLFAEKYPDLYEKYTKISSCITGVGFRSAPNKYWDFDLSTLNPAQHALLAKFQNDLKSGDDTLDLSFSLHSQYLQVLQVKAFADWESEIASTKLKVLTGEAEGIAGICTWKREVEEKKILDKDKLEFENPDAYNACVVQGRTKEVIVPEPRGIAKKS